MKIGLSFRQYPGNTKWRAIDAARRIERAVDAAYGSGLKPMEYGGSDGTAAISAAVMKALG